jgi:hypothetical protein
VLAPYAATNSSLARGLAASATLTKDRHTFTLSGSTYAGITTFTPTVDSSGFVRASTFATASRSVQLADSYKVNDKLTLGPNLSYAGTTGAGSSLLAGASAAWRPTGSDSYNASLSVGSSQPANGLVRSFSDPLSARINCFAGTAQVSGPGDLPGHQSALSYDVGWTHSWTHGQFSLDAYRQSQSGQLVGAQVTANSLGLGPGNPFYDALYGYYSNVCGNGALPLSAYVQQQVGGTTRVYQGYTATARLGIGRNVVVIPSYSTTGAMVTAADPRYTGLDSTLVLNEQIPGRPVHTGNLTVDAFHPPSGLELLANAHYVGANNNQRLAPYALVNLGLSHALGIGRITVFASNLFNTEAGAFSTLQYAQPIPLSGGGSLLQAANPNSPRQYTVSFSFNTGARAGAGLARGARGGAGAAQAAAAAASAADTPQQRGLGFGQLKFVPPPAGADVLALATARPECTADLQPLASAALGQLRAAGAAYAGGAATLPEVGGVSVTPHGDPKGAWWLSLGPNIPANLLPQRQGGANRGNGAGGAPFPRGGPGGPGGEGGPPGGFQQQVTVGAREDNGPRPAFSPSPALIAAIQPFRALASCSYGTVYTPAEAKAHGFDVPVPGVRPSPGPSAAPVAAAPQPGASPAPGASPGPGGRGRGGFGGAGGIYYAPSPGIFVVRAPDLGSGGGSVKQ